jgi:hypothetical protein
MRKEEEVSTMKRAIIAIATAVLALVLFSVVPVYAAKPTQIEGTWIATSGITLIGPEHTGGGNHFDTWSNTGRYMTGPIKGNFTQNVTITMHTGESVFVEQPPLNFLWRIDRTIYDASVDGKSGTIDMRLICKGTVVPGTPNAVNSLEGTWVIISASGELAGLHGQGTWWNIPPGILGYEGQIKFSP